MAQFSYPGPNDTWRDPYLDEMIRNAKVCKVYPGDEPDPNCPIGNCKPTEDDPCVNFAQIWDDPVVRHMIALPANKTQTSSTGMPTGSSYTSLTTATTTSGALVPQKSEFHDPCDNKCAIGLGVGLGVGIPYSFMMFKYVKASGGFGFFRAASTGQWFNFGRILKGFTRELSESTEIGDTEAELQIQQLEEACRLIDWSLTAAHGASMVTLPERPESLPPPSSQPDPAGDEEVYEDPMSPWPDPPDPPGPPGPPRGWDGIINIGGFNPNPGNQPTTQFMYQIREGSDLYRELSKPVQARFQRTRVQEEAEEEALIKYIQEGEILAGDVTKFINAVNNQFHENHIRDAEYWRECDPSRSFTLPSVYLTSYLNEPAVPRPDPPIEMVENYLRAATDAVKGIPHTDLREVEFTRLKDQISEKIVRDVTKYLKQLPKGSEERIRRKQELIPKLEQIAAALASFQYNFKLTYPDGLVKYPAKWEWANGEWITRTSEG